MSRIVGSSGCATGGRRLMAEVFDEILKRLERAARDGQRLHLEQEHVRALVASSLYFALLELKGREGAVKRDGVACFRSIIGDG